MDTPESVHDEISEFLSAYPSDWTRFKQKLVQLLIILDVLESGTQPKE